MTKSMRKQLTILGLLLVICMYAWVSNEDYNEAINAEKISQVARG